MESSAPSGSKNPANLSNSLDQNTEQLISEPETNSGDSDQDQATNNQNGAGMETESKDESSLDLSAYSHKESNVEFPDEKSWTINDLILPAENLERKLGEASITVKEREVQIRSKMMDASNAIKLALLSLTDEEKTQNCETVQNLLEKKLHYRSLAHEIKDSKYQNSNGTSPCTDLVRLQNLPRFLNLKCELWVKCEFQNVLSGSSKDRVVAMMLTEFERSGKLKPFETTIVTHTSAVFTMALTIANIKIGKKYEIVSILTDRASKYKVTLLNHMGVKVIRAPEEASDNRMSKDCPTKMAEFLSTKIRNSVVIDPFQEEIGKEAHFWWTGPELLKQFDDTIDMLVCGYETGGMISGLAPILKNSNEKCIIVGADISGQLSGQNSSEKSMYEPDTVHIEDFASPALSSILNPSAADKWIKVPIKETFLKARELMLKEGIPISASSGGVLYAALEAIKGFNLGDKKGAKIVLVMDNSVLHTDFEFSSNDWLINNNYLTHEDIEMTIWFHKIRIWRVPVKIPVTILDAFNAFAVYSMMTSNRIGRVIIQDSETKSITGVSTFDLLRQNIWNGSINSQTCIGQSTALCTSFKTISINCNVGSLLELLKTHAFAVLVQKQNVCSAQGQHKEEEWLAGILNFEDIVHFITDLEQKHSAKFGANLCGGFCRPIPTKIISNEHLSEVQNKPSKSKQFQCQSDSLNSNKKSEQCLLGSDLSSLAAGIAPIFAESVVMNSTIPPVTRNSRIPRASAGSSQPVQPLFVYAPTSSDTFVSTPYGESDPAELAQNFLASSETQNPATEDISHATSESFISVEYQIVPNANQQGKSLTDQNQTDQNMSNGAAGPSSLLLEPTKSQVQDKVVPEFTTIYSMEIENLNPGHPNSSPTSPTEERPTTATPGGPALAADSEPFAPSFLFTNIVSGSQTFTPMLPTNLIGTGHDPLNQIIIQIEDPDLRPETTVSSVDLMSLDSTIILTSIDSESNDGLQDTETDSPSAAESGMDVPVEYSSSRVNDLIMQAMYSGETAEEQIYQVSSNALISIDPSVAMSNSSSYNFIECTVTAMLPTNTTGELPESGLEGAAQPSPRQQKPEAIPEKNKETCSSNEKPTEGEPLGSHSKNQKNSSSKSSRDTPSSNENETSLKNNESP